MEHLYSNLPYIFSVVIIILCSYPLIYFKLSKKKFTEAEEKAIKKFKRIAPFTIILAILNIFLNLFLR